VQEEGESPLSRAVLCTSDTLEELVTLLLVKGADIDAQVREIEGCPYGGLPELSRMT
jgi:hypothetical protein